MKLLIVEDEKELSDSMVSYLMQEEYICELAFTYNDALHKIENRDYDCIILDLNLPGGSGLQLLKYLKDDKKSDGVIIISARNSVSERIQGLNLGADDYLVKPFHLSELVARIAAIIRRKRHDGNTLVSFHEITVDTVGKEVSVNNKAIELTRREYQLLLYLISNQNKVIPKNALINHLWNEDTGEGERFDFIYTHVKNLRKKLQQQGCDDYIKSVYGIGYKLTSK